MGFERILAVESSTEMLQLAISVEKGSMSLILDQGLTHAESLVPLIKSMLDDQGLKPADLQGLVCSRGPGSFTGLRIGMAAMKGMSAALGIPLASVSGLDALARPWLETLKGGPYSGTHAPLIPLMDARKQRLYAALYRWSPDAPGWEGEYLDLSPGDLIQRISGLKILNGAHPCILTGPGAPLLAGHQSLETMGAARERIICMPRQPWVIDLLELGRQRLEAGLVDSPDQAPEYLRNSDAELGIMLKGRN